MAPAQPVPVQIVWMAQKDVSRINSEGVGQNGAPSLQLQPIFLDLLTFPNHGGLGIWSRKKFELEIACEHGRIILEKRRPEVRCTVVVSQRPGCLRYLPKILCDNINYSQSQWRCSLFHIYRAHQFSAVSRVTGRNFHQSVEHGPLFKGIWKTTLDRQYVTRLSYPKGSDVWVI